MWVLGSQDETCPLRRWRRCDEAIVLITGDGSNGGKIILAAPIAKAAEEENRFVAAAPYRKYVRAFVYKDIKTISWSVTDKILEVVHAYP